MKKKYHIIETRRCEEISKRTLNHLYHIDSIYNLKCDLRAGNWPQVGCMS